ncbi:MAG: ferrochelatase [Deltaproteobacteria bacterium]|nr:ferrochelatase [Deltaproteobacteria bacterium]
MIGVLLVNLGTPDSPDPSAVRRYLREFLSDPRVMDIGPVARWLLVNLVILPTRPRTSAAAYQKIWTERGSPLLAHTRDLADAVAAALGERFAVRVAMRYGRPSIETALDELGGADRIVVLPLFPQYSSASTGSALERVMRLAATRDVIPALRVIGSFHEDPGTLDAFAAVGRPVIAETRPDHVLFSFHGLPERQVLRSDGTGRTCLRTDACCDGYGAENRRCYRASCFETARQVARRLDLAAGAFSVSFQSRLGRTRWIEPHTDVVVRDLARTGVRRLVVFSPSFVADCVETLEELGIRARDDFARLGGAELRLVPSLNATPGWVEAVARMVRDAAGS